MQYEISSRHIILHAESSSNDVLIKSPNEWSKVSSKFEQPNNNSINLKDSKNSRQYLIYYCNSSCGGFGDRLRGMVNTFVLSRITGRDFGIFHPNPCPLENFFDENQHSWKLDDHVLEGKSSETYNLIDNRTLPSNNMTSYFKEDVVYLQSNTDITIHLIRQADVPKRWPLISTLSTADIYRSVLKNLFVLNTKLQDELDTFRSIYVGNNRTICAHYRAGKNPTIDNDLPRNVGNISNLWEFLSRYDEEENVIYLATDSDEIQTEARHKYPKRIITIPGKIVHTEKSEDDTECSGFKKTILEHTFLSECDVLLLTESGFGRTAGFIRQHSRDLFCLQKTGVYRCSRTTLPSMLPGTYSACTGYNNCHKIYSNIITHLFCLLLIWSFLSIYNLNCICF